MHAVLNFFNISLLLLSLIFCSNPLHAKSKKQQASQAKTFSTASEINFGAIYDNSGNMRTQLMELSVQKYKILSAKGMYFYANYSDASIKQNLMDGKNIEPHIALLIKKYVKNRSTVLDIGAHIGVHTLNLSRAVGSTGRVIAFESHPVIFKELVMNMLVNDRRHGIRSQSSSCL